MQYMSALYNKTMKSPARVLSAQERAAEEHAFATKAFGPCEFRPVPGVSFKVSCTVDGTYTCEWQDDRRPAHIRHSDAAAEPDVGSGSVSLASIAHVLQTINHIIFADTSQETADAGAIPRGEKPLVLHLQRMDDRAAVRRVTVWTDAHGQLQRFHVCDGAAASTIVHTHAGALMAILKEMCGGEGAPSPPSTHRSRWVVIRSPMWAEMPSELWWHILKLFTQREGRAVSCACKCIAQTVALPAFIWLHEKIHLDILHASDAIRNDKRTNMPINVAEGEMLIGRSRNNTVVLLRDTELSKEHCKLWRDIRGDIWIQDLASTNGTKVNGVFLRPASGGAARGGKRKSEVQKLMVGDTIKVGITTLQLKPGHVLPKGGHGGGPGGGGSGGTSPVRAPEAGAGDEGTPAQLQMPAQDVAQH